MSSTKLNNINLKANVAPSVSPRSLKVQQQQSPAKKQAAPQPKQQPAPSPTKKQAPQQQKQQQKQAPQQQKQQPKQQPAASPTKKQAPQQQKQAPQQQKQAPQQQKQAPQQKQQPKQAPASPSKKQAWASKPQAKAAPASPSKKQAAPQSPRQLAASYNRGPGYEMIFADSFIQQLLGGSPSSASGNLSLNVPAKAPQAKGVKAVPHGVSAPNSPKRREKRLHSSTQPAPREDYEEIFGGSFIATMLGNVGGFEAAAPQSPSKKAAAAPVQQQKPQTPTRGRSSSTGAGLKGSEKTTIDSDAFMNTFFDEKTVSNAKGAVEDKTSKASPNRKSSAPSSSPRKNVVSINLIASPSKQQLKPCITPRSAAASPGKKQQSASPASPVRKASVQKAPASPRDTRPRRDSEDIMDQSFLQRKLST